MNEKNALRVLCPLTRTRLLLRLGYGALDLYAPKAYPVYPVCSIRLTA